MRTSRLITLLLFLVIFSSAVWAQLSGPGNARLISMPEYELSDADKALGIDGKMTLMVKIDKTGKVKNAEVWAGPYWPCEAKLESEIKKVRTDVRNTMLAAKFEPAMQNSQPRDTEILMTFLIGNAYDSAKDPNVRSLDSSNVPKTIKAGILNGKAKDLPRPEYPAGARGVSLTSVHVVIDEEGKVIIAGSESGAAELAFGDAARAAACKAKFLPLLMDGNRVRVTGLIEYNFGLVVR